LLHFGEENFNVEYNVYKRHTEAVKNKIICLGKRSIQDKENVLSIFGNESWDTLTTSKKAMHSLYNCKGCLKEESLRSGLRMFPIKEKDRVTLKKATNAGLFRPSEDTIRNNTISTVKDLNQHYHQTYGASFDKFYRLAKGQDTPSQVFIHLVLFLMFLN